MDNYQRMIAVTLIVCLVPTLCGDGVTILRAASPPNPLLPERQVELLGAGVGVAVKLRSGEKLEGSIGAIDTQGFDLISRRAGSPRRITYGEVTELKLAKLTYRASGPPNAQEARRAVVGLGIGKHVAVKLTSGKKLRGHLQAIDEDRFVLLPDREAAPVGIAYGEVQEIGPNLSTGVKIAIIVGVALVVALIIFAVAWHETTEKMGF